MRNIENHFITILLLISFGCSTENNRYIIKEYINNEGQNVIEYQLNDSIIERVMTKNSKIEARELENTNSDSIEILYYDEFEKLYQSLKFDTKNSNSLITNYLYFSNGKISEKYIKNHNGEKLESYKYYLNNKLERADFYQEGNSYSNAYVSYKPNGKINLAPDKTNYIRIEEKEDSIFIYPVGLGTKRFQKCRFEILDSLPNINDKSFRMSSIKEMVNCEKIGLSISELKKIKSKLICHVMFCNFDEVLICKDYLFFIESLERIPKNNLFYIRKQ